MQKIHEERSLKISLKCIGSFKFLFAFENNLLCMVGTQKLGWIITDGFKSVNKLSIGFLLCMKAVGVD